MNYIKTGMSLLLLLCSLAGIAGSVKAPADTIDYRHELLRVFERNQTATHEIMHFRYYVHDVNGGTATLVDTLQLTGRFQGRKHFYAVGDIAQVQDEQYKVTIYRRDSTLYVEKPGMGSAYQALYQLNLLERDIYNKFVDTILVKDSGEHRIISLLFKSHAPYIRYDVVYTKANYQLVKVQYLLRAELAPANNPAYVPAKYRRITLLRDANTSLTNAAPISTRDYIIWKDGKLVPAPAYSNYRIIAAHQ